MAEEDLKWAIEQYKNPLRVRYTKYKKYYDGEHKLAFASSRFRSTFAHLFEEFADNLCPAVVDSLAERLKITSWTSNHAAISTEPAVDESGAQPPANQPQQPTDNQPQVPSVAATFQKITVDDPEAEAATELWERNMMNTRANKVHTEAIKEGDAYLLVWPNKEMEAEFWPQTALEMSVEYDANRLGIISRACKIWWLPVEKKWRLNVYLEDRIEKYITAQASPNGIPQEATGWNPLSGENGEGSTIPNPYGRVPVFHFANRNVFAPGISDLKDVIAIQDGLNKSVMDMLVAMEYASFKQRYIIGMEVETDENTGEPVNENVRQYGVDRMMSIPGDKNEVAVGQFEATDLGQFREVSNDFRAEVARVSGTPLHYFYIQIGDFPSGEAIKSAEARFVSRIEGRQEDWAPQWGEALKFAMAIESTVADDLQLNPIWGDASPRSEAELADTAVKKKAVGVSRSQLLREMGYSDEQIVRMLQESDALAAQQAAMNPPPTHDQPPTDGGGQTAESKNRAADARRRGDIPGVKK